MLLNYLVFNIKINLIHLCINIYKLRFFINDINLKILKKLYFLIIYKK